MLGRTLGGRLAEARALLTDPDGRFGPQDALRRRLDAHALRSLLEACELRIERLQGDGVLEAWIPGSVRDGGPAATAAVRDLEELAAATAPLLEVAARLHAMARRPAGPDGSPGPAHPGVARRVHLRCVADHTPRKPVAAKSTRPLDESG